MHRHLKRSEFYFFLYFTSHAQLSGGNKIEIEETTQHRETPFSLSSSLNLTWKDFTSANNHLNYTLNWVPEVRANSYHEVFSYEFQYRNQTVQKSSSSFIYWSKPENAIVYYLPANFRTPINPNDIENRYQHLTASAYLPGLASQVSLNSQVLNLHDRAGLHPQINFSPTVTPSLLQEQYYLGKRFIVQTLDPGRNQALALTGLIFEWTDQGEKEFSGWQLCSTGRSPVCLIYLKVSSEEHEKKRLTAATSLPQIHSRQSSSDSKLQDIATKEKHQNQQEKQSLPLQRSRKPVFVSNIANICSLGINKLLPGKIKGSDISVIQIMFCEYAAYTLIELISSHLIEN